MGIETSMEGNNFVFASLDEMYYECHRKSINCRRPYIDSPDLIKIKKQQ